jgi:hypothetical protein
MFTITGNGGNFSGRKGGYNEPGRCEKEPFETSQLRRRFYADFFWQEK